MAIPPNQDDRSSETDDELHGHGASSDRARRPYVAPFLRRLDISQGTGGKSPFPSEGMAPFSGTGPS